MDSFYCYKNAAAYQNRKWSVSDKFCLSVKECGTIAITPAATDIDPYDRFWAFGEFEELKTLADASRLDLRQLQIEAINKALKEQNNER